MDKFYVEYSLRDGTNNYHKDEVSEEILKNCTRMSEIKPLYLKSMGLTFRDLKYIRLIVPVGMDEED
jgi:hypothetical protein